MGVPTYQQRCASRLIQSVEDLIQGNKEFSSDSILDAIEHFKKRAMQTPPDPTERRLFEAVVKYLEENLNAG